MVEPDEARNFETASKHILLTAFERYRKLPFACVILDAGYDSQEFHRDIYTDSIFYLSSFESRA